MKFAVWQWCKSVWIIVVPYSLCAGTVSFWTLDPGFPTNVVCTAAALNEIHVSSVTECSALCTREPGSTSFTYAPAMVPSCYMLPAVPLSTAGCNSVTNARTYVKVEMTFSCHPNDGLYHAYILTDGTIFYYRISHLLKDDQSARADCTATGGSLVKMSTTTKLAFMQNLFTTCPGGFGETYFVGGSVPHVDGTWVWDDGEPIDPVLWAPGGMDRDPTQLCVRMDPVDNWKFNDMHCDWTYYYICEKQLTI